MDRKNLFVANWKMHKTLVEARSFIEVARKSDLEMYIAAPFTALLSCVEAASGSSIHIGSQNISNQSSGAFTGEVSAHMVADLGATFTLIGHSERRTLYHESESLIAEKIHRALEHQLTPIICIGESAKDRELGNTHAVLESQLRGALKSFTEEHLAHFVLAYEPVWAIGTGVSATPDMAQETHKEVRRLIAEIFSESTADKLPILYGGSVKPDNISQLMDESDIDGALIGGASLDVESYTQILKQGTKS